MTWRRWGIDMDNPSITAGERAVVTGMLAQVARFDDHLESALRRVAPMFAVDLDELPSLAVVELALNLHPGPPPYLAIPHRVLVDHGVESYPLDAFDAYGPAGHRCSAGCATGAGQARGGMVRDQEAGADLWCLLPLGHHQAHGYETVRALAVNARSWGAELELEDPDESLDAMVAAITTDPGPYGSALRADWHDAAAGEDAADVGALLPWAIRRAGR